jgi:hypothetical protein
MKFAEAAKGKPRPSLAKLVQQLQSLPNGEVFSTRELAARGFHMGCIRHFGTETDLQAYRYRNGHAAYWGNPKSIVDFKKYLKEQGQ